MTHELFYSYLQNIYEKCKTIANYSSEDYFKNVQQAILGIPDTVCK